jgi:serine/threonine-protein kinase RsbW
VMAVPNLIASILPQIHQLSRALTNVKTRALTFAGGVIYSVDSFWRPMMAVPRMPENASHTPETVERLMESTLESVDSAEELAVQMAERAGVEEDDLMKVGMAVRESMVNAVVHGNRYNGNKKVRLSMMTETDRFIIRVADEGEGFDFDSLPDPLAPENLMKTSGRGIFLMRSFMDEFQIRQLESGGTEVTLIKTLVSK